MTTAEERREWALHDRTAKAIIGTMLTFQVLLLLSTMLWC